MINRAIIKELPRVMTIYDVDIPLKTAKAAISWQFRKNAQIQDGRYISFISSIHCVTLHAYQRISLQTTCIFRVINLLLAKGYMELEETLRQWKQKTHLLRILEPSEMQYVEQKPLSYKQKLILGVNEHED